MKNKFILLFVILILLTGCKTKEVVVEDTNNHQSNSVNYAKDIEELKNKIESLEAKNEELNNKISSYENNTITLRSEIEKIKTEYTNDLHKLKQELNKTNNVESLNKVINTLEDKITKLESGSDDIYIVKFNSGGSQICYKNAVDYKTHNVITTCSFSYSLVVKNGETYGNYLMNINHGFPTPYGYGSDKKFMGWFTEKNGKGQKILSTTIVNLKSDIEIYAYYY